MGRGPEQRRLRRRALWIGAAGSILLHLTALIALSWSPASAPPRTTLSEPTVTVALLRPATAAKPQPVAKARQAPPSAAVKPQVQAPSAAGPTDSDPKGGGRAPEQGAHDWAHVFAADPPACPREDVALMTPAERIRCSHAHPASVQAQALTPNDPIAAAIRDGAFKGATVKTVRCDTEAKPASGMAKPDWSLKTGCTP
jgi:hypothetical protein